MPGAGALTAAPHDATAQAVWGQGGGGPANPQALNRYSYVLNNPVNNTDPTGHKNSIAEPSGGGGGGGMCLTCGGSAGGAARAVGDAATIAAGTALIADGVQGTAAEKSTTALEARQSSQSAGANPPWRKLQPYRGQTRTNGQTGKNRRYYEKDYTHGDVEVYDRNGNHLGSMDPDTGKMTKPEVDGRVCKNCK